MTAPQDRDARRTACMHCARKNCPDHDGKGGCYYTPARVRGKLADLPYDVANHGDPNSYTKRPKAQNNPQEDSWAIRGDLERALGHVRGAVPNGPTIEQVVVLAYVGVPTGPSRAGRWAGVPDAQIARLLHLDERTVSRYRDLGLAMMVRFLNPGHRPQED